METRNYDISFGKHKSVHFNLKWFLIITRILKSTNGKFLIELLDFLQSAFKGDTVISNVDSNVIIGRNHNFLYEFLEPISDEHNISL